MARELVAHVMRRLGVGAYPDLVDRLGDDTDGALAAALDDSTPVPELPAMEPPPPGEQPAPGGIALPWAWWFERLIAGARPIEERLVWFWHDHFATSIEKVKVPYLLWEQHRVLRAHATGNFRELLHAISSDAAMLDYLDGTQNTKEQLNENFGREVMELHTLGRGNYTEADVVAAARACTGWIVPRGGTRAPPGSVPYSALFVPRRHDGSAKTLLGVTGKLDLGGALDVLLTQSATGPFVAGKLYEHLVGIPPDDATREDLGQAFARDWAIMPLVERIAGSPKFLSGEAYRVKIRTPLEKVVALAHAVPLDAGVARAALGWLRSVEYVPFAPPNPAGYPDGLRLLGPYELVRAFDLAGGTGAGGRALGALGGTDLLARFGVRDASATTVEVLEAEADPSRRLALALASPEVTVA